MSPEQFVYWFQGFAELNEGPPSEQQWQAIRDHLSLVFDKRTPDYSADKPVEYTLPVNPWRTPPQPTSADEVPYWLRPWTCSGISAQQDQTYLVC